MTEVVKIEPASVPATTQSESAALGSAARDNAGRRDTDIRQDRERAVSALLARHAGREATEALRNDEAYRDTPVGRAIIAEAQQHGVSVAVVRGMAEHSPAVNNPDGIFVDVSYGDDETWHLFDHEIAHEYDTSELCAQIDVDSETARAYREWASVSAGRMMDDAMLAEEIVADILSGRTDLLVGHDLLDTVRDAGAFSQSVQSFERMRAPQTRFSPTRRGIPPRRGNT
jgi:hypothetical protein